ncbi:MAG: glutamate synthase subunit beta [Blautia sp.]|nr:glutamate synthase subunit beta [Blautia sp.]
MGKTTGFLEYVRKDGPVRTCEERLGDFLEFHDRLPLPAQKEQAGRCMDCGIPFCQAGMMIAGMASGCPLHNLVPEINDLVWHGRMAEAYRRLSITHSFPEFTSRVCPALCEAACTCGLHDAPVATKENEKAVIEYAYAHGLVKEETPAVRTGKKVAVVGSGPAGLAAAQLLNRRGHEVTVYERKDRIGGLLRYGIPNMKLDKSLLDRRIRLMEEAGIRFVVNADVGKTVSADELRQNYDSVILSCGASNPRDIRVPGREAEGIWFAVDFLGMVTRKLLDLQEKQKDPKLAGRLPLTGVPASLVRGKDVIVIGGGDTGNDCTGTCLRLGAKSVTQLEMMPKPSETRLPSNPWPEWPRVLKTDYGQEEAIWRSGEDPRIYQTTVKEFIKDKKGHVKEAVLQSLTPVKDEKTGRMQMVPVEDSERKVPAGLVLIAAGFLGSEAYVTESFGVETDARTNVRTEPGGYRSSREGIYTAGDMHRGQSLVVWAIREGREAARAVDEALMGYTTL